MHYLPQAEEALRKGEAKGSLPMSEIRELWVEDYEAGATYIEVANKYGVAESTVYKYIKRKGLGRTRKQAAHYGNSHHMWKGQEADQNSIHRWVRIRLPKPEYCDGCGNQPPVDLANVSDRYNPATYTRELENWRWLCRSCHMFQDGRIKNLRHQA